MEFKFLKLQIKPVDSATVAIITLDKPPVNALSSDFLYEISKCVDHCVTEKVELAIFRGSEKAFIAGADISQMKDMSAEQAREFSSLGHEVMNKIECSDFLSLAVLNGYALGGGLELALACNLRFASENAILGLPEVSLGLIPGFGGTYRLAREIGTGNAVHAICSAAKFNAKRAHELGLVQKVIPSVDFEEIVEKEVSDLLRNGPIAFRMAKNLIIANYSKSSQEALTAEQKAFSQLFIGDEAKEGMAAFLEKRKADFRNES